LINQYYIPFEVWYIRTSVDKVCPSFHGGKFVYFSILLQAHHLSSPDVSLTPATTTTPDDVFYILKLVATRILSTGSLICVEKTFEQVQDVLERDYIGKMKKKLDDAFRASSSGPLAKGDRADKDNRVALIVSGG
jgi:conserved oligomeric Golgi complex subunit 4